MKKLNTLQKVFIAIGFFTVVLVIGIGFALSIQYFANQQKVENDLKVEHDVKHVAIKIETWLINEKDRKAPLTEDNLAIALDGITLEPGVSIAVTGHRYAYCIIGVHDNGNKYVKPSGTDAKPVIENAFNYNSQTGGMGKSCEDSSPAYTLPNDWSKIAPA